MAAVVTELRDLARDLQVPVVACSQLSRECESEKRRPNMKDLAESSTLEAAAAQVVFPFRPAAWNMSNGKVPYTNDYAEYIVAKNRNGKTGIKETAWTAKFVRFED